MTETREYDVKNNLHFDVHNNKRKKRQKLPSDADIENEDKLHRIQFEKDYAAGYIKKLIEKLDENSLHEILMLIEKIELSSCDVKTILHKIKIVLNNYADLQWEFLGFLQPYQALECGKLMDYFELCNLKEFIYKLSINFKKQPCVIRKIIDRLCYYVENKKDQIENLEDILLPYVAKNSILIQLLLKLQPFEKPPEWLFLDEDSWEDFSIDNEITDKEMMEIPSSDNSITEMKSCIYGCNINTSLSHCLICNVKYINGRMYIANGRMLRPANIIFESSVETENIKRLTGKADYFVSSNSRTRIQKRLEISKESNNEGSLSPFIFGTESEEETGENDIQRQKRKRQNTKGLKVRFKKQKKVDEVISNDIQTDDTAPSNDDCSCDETSYKEDNYEECMNRLKLENLVNFNKEVVNLEDIEFNISVTNTSNIIKNDVFHLASRIT